MPSRRRALLVAVVAVVVGATAACGGDDHSSSGGGQEAAGGSGPLLLGQAQTERKVVYTAELDVRLPSAGKAAATAVKETKRLGGHLFSQSAEDGSRTAEL